MAALTVAMTLEGVLAGRDDDIQLAQAMCEPLGKSLFVALATTARMVLLTNQDRRLAEHWLAHNGCTQYSALLPLTDGIVRRLRAGGETPDLYIDWSPSRCAQAVKDGVVTMLHARPLYARSGFQRTGLPGLQRPFAQVERELAAQKDQRSRPVYDEDEDEPVRD